MVMRFSVPASLLPVLSAGGVTHVSLANNHALDFGEEGYHHTRDELETLGLGVVGHPTRIDDDSVAYIEVGGKVIAVLGVNATYGGVSDDWTDVLETSSMQSDVQIVYIHWGEEYQPWHSESQEELARLFVDTGADIVIGHHPHVVQDIESYKNGLIFYSLGNFIFDQYWNDDVSEGLMLELVLGGKDPHVSLLPVESKTERVRPRLMSVDERTAFLEGLSKRSSAMLAEDIMRGAIPLQF
jgi:poly-gamma-glutamate synthesis protein (capsule biosynthesis protein)